MGLSEKLTPRMRVATAPAMFAAPVSSIGRGVIDRSRLARPGRQETEAERATPFTALGQPQTGTSPEADHRAVDLYVAKCSMEPFAT